MPKSRRPKPLYQRGDYALYERLGRNLEIVWYDHGRKRELSTSAATRNIAEGRLALDRKFLASEGARHCPTCGRPWDAAGNPLLLSIIADYLLRSQDKAGEKSAKTRLSHIVRYLNATKPTMTVAGADAEFADEFRKWMSLETIAGGSRGKGDRKRAESSIEGCLLQLAAAINAAPGQKARFKPAQQKNVSNSPYYRADVATIAAMFNFCLRPDGASVRHWRSPDQASPKLVLQRRRERSNLLRYLRAAVATWARPDAIYDLSRKQWYAAASVLDLKAPNRPQTRKHRPKIPVARQFVDHLDHMGDAWLSVVSIRSSWNAMMRDLDLPRDGEAGEKLIRRSMATIARKRLGEANWIQGKMMLGHVKHDISDIYALPDPANLGMALAATEAIIDEIESLAPGAFYGTFTAPITPACTPDASLSV